MYISAEHRTRLFHHLKIAVIVLLCLVAGMLLVLAARWPFTRQATIDSLEQVAASDVHISGFQKRFFPHPGYVAEDVIFTRGSDSGTPPIVKIGKITCRATWFALITFTHRINRMELNGVQVQIPAHVPPPVRKHAQATIKTTVTELDANGAMLEIAPRHEGGHPLQFAFPELTVTNLARDKAVTFRALIRNPTPPGDLSVSGSFGPLPLRKVDQARISGSFSFRHADLSVYKAISGVLAADGRFNGMLSRAEVVGHAEVPNFELTSTGHSQGISLEYDAVVNGIKGDVAIRSAGAHFLRTTLQAHGSVTGKPGKTVSLDFDSAQAHVEDLLHMFAKANPPSLDGNITLRAHVVLPPTHEPFLQRVRLDGDFSIPAAEFTNATTQQKVDGLSARASGDKKKTDDPSRLRAIPSHFEAEVDLRHEIAVLPKAVFVVPGAVARLSGTYNLSTQAVNFRGKLAMRASLSRAAGGVKSLLLIPLDPFFKKNGAGAVLPVSITGTYSHPAFKVSLRR